MRIKQRRTHQRFQHALYGKLFGKDPPFGIVKASLLGLWNELGTIHISDMPNGFLLIRCATAEARDHLLFGGPWTVHRVTLQLAPWQPNFEPAFTRLTKAVIWVQLHNFPVDLWDGDSLETHMASIGRLVKVDEYTASLSRTRYARACLEIDLAYPLKPGFWLEDGDKRVFVMVVYERVPTFCYTCGMVGHGASTCTTRRGPTSAQPSAAGQANAGNDRSSQVQNAHETPEPRDKGLSPQTPLEETIQSKESGIGPWMRPNRRRGRGRGRGGAGGMSSRAPHMTPGLNPEQLDRVTDERHVEGTIRAIRTRSGDERRGKGRSFHPASRCVPSSSRVHDSFGSSDMGLVQPVPESRPQVESPSVDEAKHGKGKRKSCSSPPLLLMSSMDRDVRAPMRDTDAYAQVGVLNHPTSDSQNLG
ncbi:hypothetical protein J5N97_000776 [Dioscorea zingiberensis]|uniref:CCHC-type domain-containing protein n=1 Tax=Dioscorea zingiberensis TaxID=325984 RepID=A0A9D5H2P4_9LILI|nr:hypothetical protein J5N97_000776 [Dioscorea zingiberensis]